MKKLLFILIFYSSLASAQTMHQRAFSTADIDQWLYYSLYPSNILEVNDGFIIAGHTQHGLPFIIKTDKFMNYKWAKALEIYPGVFAEIAMSKDNYLCAIGTSGQKETKSLVKFNFNGDVVWTKAFEGPGDSQGTKIKCLSNGDVLIAGSYTVNSNAYNSLIKCNAAGNILWSKNYDMRTIRDVLQLSDTTAILVGGANDEGDLRKINLSTGSVIWAKQYHPISGNLRLTSIVKGNNNDFYISGKTTIPIVLKTDADGNMIWSKIFDISTSNNEAPKIISTSDGNFVFSGMYVENFKYNIFSIKINNNGDTLWTNSQKDATDGSF
ncbi:MAG: hypothetical protein H0X62_13515, partial [Bacteroidetes bacterium]|nr:hypothetical protein [Bacteroidota bacterium]